MRKEREREGGTLRSKSVISFFFQIHIFSDRTSCFCGRAMYNRALSILMPWNGRAAAQLSPWAKALLPSPGSGGKTVIMNATHCSQIIKYKCDMNWPIRRHEHWQTLTHTHTHTHTHIKTQTHHRLSMEHWWNQMQVLPLQKCGCCVVFLFQLLEDIIWINNLMEIPPHSLKAQLSPGNYTLADGHRHTHTHTHTRTQAHKRIYTLSECKNQFLILFGKNEASDI